MTGEAARTVAVIGGGAAGAVLSIKLSRARPQDRVLLIERDRRAGVGLAYGACSPSMLLNVPVSRMELGLEPRFGDWLRGNEADLSEALSESGGVLEEAFVPRALFGRYVEARLEASLSGDPERGLRRVRGEAVHLAEPPERGVVLADGRTLAAELVVLALGNPAPLRLPFDDPAGVLESEVHVPDPWAPGAFDGIPDGAGVLLIGAGLTAVDVALHLAATTPVGRITALSRHGRTPATHEAGGAWPRFWHDAPPRTAGAALRSLRVELARAEAAGVPWQRVFDAARPDVARVWRGWDLPARRAFLRHLRGRWDVRRHRMAPRIAASLDSLLASGRLDVRAGRVRRLEAADRGAIVVVQNGDGLVRLGPFARIVNCTGPQTELHRTETPLLASLRRTGLVRPDPLGLGLETRGGAVLDAEGDPSAWLYAVGPLTRPALWEVTAVPEINAQIDMLVARLSEPGVDRPELPLVFADLGAGI